MDIWPAHYTINTLPKSQCLSTIVTLVSIKNRFHQKPFLKFGDLQQLIVKSYEVY